jgi:hypothetical protein
MPYLSFRKPAFYPPTPGRTFFTNRAPSINKNLCMLPIPPPDRLIPRPLSPSTRNPRKPGTRSGNLQKAAGFLAALVLTLIVGYNAGFVVGLITFVLSFGLLAVLVEWPSVWNGTIIGLPYAVAGYFCTLERFYYQPWKAVLTAGIIWFLFVLLGIYSYKRARR